MDPKDVNNARTANREPTRREFVALAALSAATAAGGVSGSWAGQTTASRTSNRPWWFQADPKRSRVVDVRSAFALNSGAVDKNVLNAVLSRGLLALTETERVEAAWRKILGTARKIVLKFNGVAADALGTTDAMADVLVESLEQAGYGTDVVALVEAPHAARRLKTREPEKGWGAAIQFGEHREELANYLYACDALINVPFLKTHRIAGMSGCLKNLSHALVRRPARYHADACSPFVGQIVSSREITSRLKLNLVNAIRVVVNRGPDAQEEDISANGGLLLGFDPLAMDIIGRDLLASYRKQRGLLASLSIPYLDSATKIGLGRSRSTEIELIRERVGR